MEELPGRSARKAAEAVVSTGEMKAVNGHMELALSSPRRQPAGEGHLARSHRTIVHSGPRQGHGSCESVSLQLLVRVAVRCKVVRHLLPHWVSSSRLRAFFERSQAEAHYKGNRHARRVKGIETSKSRPQDNDRAPPAQMASPSPPGPPAASLDNDPSKSDEATALPQLNGPHLPPCPPPSAPPTPDSPVLPTCPLLPPSANPPLASTPSPSLGSGTTRADQPGPGPAGPPGAPGVALSTPESEEDKAKKLLYCSLCKVAVNSLSQLEAHNKVRLLPCALPLSAIPFQCSGILHATLWHLSVFPSMSLQHISSRRHRDGVAGKPNPLLGRHKKHRTADLTSSLSFSKDLTKALGAGLLPSPLAVAAAMAAAASSTPLALRAAGPAPHPHHHLLQGPPLSHALLRPAPGPIRTSHGPILFSPY
ncbi:zinc finger protein 385A-like [Scleropages formosus]|uniref:Zinc finger protein 385A-like n=1 Tax=Scleropages formosus TaxID=113540 RepID=A0A0N8JY59_SCLFO|nr:zinc finger protein 385A-like [Scleropages formosus]